MTGNQSGEHWDADDHEEQEREKCRDCGYWYVCVCATSADTTPDEET